MDALSGALALSDGAYFAYGENFNGELGDGTAVRRTRG